MGARLSYAPQESATGGCTVVRQNTVIPIWMLANFVDDRLRLFWSRLNRDVVS